MSENVEKDEEVVDNDDQKKFIDIEEAIKYATRYMASILYRDSVLRDVRASLEWENGTCVISKDKESQEGVFGKCLIGNITYRYFIYGERIDMKYEDVRSVEDLLVVPYLQFSLIEMDKENSKPPITSTSFRELVDICVSIIVANVIELNFSMENLRLGIREKNRLAELQPNMASIANKQMDEGIVKE